jgi:hypothetical protein
MVSFEVEKCAGRLYDYKLLIRTNSQETTIFLSTKERDRLIAKLEGGA